MHRVDYHSFSGFYDFHNGFFDSYNKCVDAPAKYWRYFSRAFFRHGAYC
jgi:hypothetical protein